MYLFFRESSRLSILVVGLAICYILNAKCIPETHYFGTFLLI